MLQKKPPTESQKATRIKTWLLDVLQVFGFDPANTLRSVLAELRTVASLYLLILAIFLPLGRGHFLSTDHVAVYQVTRSLVEDHDLSIEPINTTVLGPDGQYYSVFGVGQSILSIPFYLLGKLVDRFATVGIRTYLSGENMEMWGGTVPIFFVSSFNQFVVPIIGVLVYLFGRRLGFSTKRSIFLSVIFSFGTIAWSQAIDYFQHPLETLWLLLAIYVLFANRDRLYLQHAWVAGSCLGFGMLTRVNLTLVYPLLVIYLWHQLKKQSPQNHPEVLRFIQVFSLPVLFAFIVLLYLNQAKYGNALIFNPVHISVGWVSPAWTGLYGYLFSPGRSIFLYSPPLLLVIYAWLAFYHQHKAEAWLFLGISLVYLVAYVFFADWAGGWSWGPRYLFAILPLFIPLLGYRLEKAWERIIAIGLTCLGAWIQVLGILINYDYIHGDWERLGFTYPSQEYIFIPSISPIVMHLQALLEGRYIDTWLFWVYQQYGIGVVLASLVLPVALLVTGLYLLKPHYARNK